jgi:hypothetical protein
LDGLALWLICQRAFYTWDKEFRLQACGSKASNRLTRLKVAPLSPLPNPLSAAAPSTRCHIRKAPEDPTLPDA